MIAPTNADLIESVEGWISQPEADFLREQARIAVGNIINIGTYRGLSALILAAGIAESDNPQGRCVYTIDPHTGIGVNGARFSEDDLHFAYRNFAKFKIGGLIRVLACRSSQIIRSLGVAGLAFIDGDHTYETVYHDIYDSGALLTPGSRIACHDYSLASVKRAVDQFVLPERGCIVGTTRWWTV